MSEYRNVFVRFAEQQAHGSSPLYETLAQGIADDDELLALADEVPEDQPTPNLLFAAVQYLLFERPDDPLGSYYPSISDSPATPNERAFDLFRDFCLTYSDRIVCLFAARRVQTNVVRRSAILFPVFESRQNRGTSSRRTWGLSVRPVTCSG